MITLSLCVNNPCSTFAEILLMRPSRGFVLLSRIILINVFLVIISGGVVRMTQSGMGCPDWPKCFGRWIPPTDESQLPANYKQIYAFKYVDTSFNPYHTWIEYINRLAGATLGLFLFIQFIWSLKYRNSRRRITWLSFILLLLTGFQGWLGSKVVEANLEVAKVTTHMLVALIIAALAYQVIFESITTRSVVINKKLKWLVSGIIILLLAQIVMGTGVREQIDIISKAEGFINRESWIEQLNVLYYVHRSFSLIVAACCIFMFIKYKKYETLKDKLMSILLLVAAIIALGAVMNYFSIPALAQPAHLLFSSVLVVVLYSLFLRVRSIDNVP